MNTAKFPSRIFKNNNLVSKRINKRFNTAVPGMYVYQNFLSPKQQKNVQEHSINLHKIISNNSNDKMHLSKNHNLKSIEHYCAIDFVDGLRRIKGQHFQRYGEDNHKLTYFI